MWQETVKRLGQRFGLDIAHFRPAAGRRAEIMASLEIGMVLDVGANVGQYATELRRFGYGGSILSFEPVSEAFDELVRASSADAGWECVRLALGQSDGSAKLGVTSNTASSSFQECSKHIGWPRRVYRYWRGRSQGQDHRLAGTRA